MKTKVEQLKDMMKAKKEVEVKKEAEIQKEQLTEQAASEDITAQIKSAEDEAKAHYDKLLRVLAEFENFKKRIGREQADHAKYANQSLICDLLPVVDDFDRVLDHIPKDASAEVAAIADGIKIIQNHFMTALSKHGFHPLESSTGQNFDPCRHEAVAHIESEEHPEGTVAIEHRRGWKLHDRVVRAATVSVSKGKPK